MCHIIHFFYFFSFHPLIKVVFGKPAINGLIAKRIVGYVRTSITYKFCTHLRKIINAKKEWRKKMCVGGYSFDTMAFNE